MTDTDEAVIDDLYLYAHLLGIKPADARDAIDRTGDKRDQLRRWKREYLKLSRGVLIANGKRWAKANAEEAAERHTTLRDEQQASRRSARDQKSLGRRIDALWAETLLEPGPGVSAVGSTKIQGGEGDGMPPDAAEWATDFELHIKPGTTFRSHWLVLKNYIERLEGEWDRFLGRDEAKNWKSATEAEKDHEIINRYIGVSSAEVARINPELGDKQKIEAVRKSRKLSPRTGEPK